MFTAQGVLVGLTAMITVFVITCPHALGLAIPTVTTISTTLAAKHGILIKDMNALELAKKIDYVIFDKT
jgi:Cu2+-exporting ATPase